MLAVIIISLTAVAGAFLIPFLHKQVIMYVLDLFVAMGVSTMLADALLHLLPQVCYFLYVDLILFFFFEVFRTAKVIS